MLKYFQINYKSVTLQHINVNKLVTNSILGNS